MLAREDFNNDRIDAGEIGSGHTVTALYEITPTDSSSRLVDDLRYGLEKAAIESSGSAMSDEVAWLRLRFKRPGEDKSELIEQPVFGADATTFEQAGQEAKFVAAVAAFGQILKRSPHLGSLDFDAVAEMARTVRGDDPFGYRSDFLQLVRLAKSASVLEAGNG
jgi:Ca-activated chloride channel family protein